MKVNIVMPKMGESITEGTLIKWYKSKGEKVEKDEIIFEIATDKVDTEIPSPESGILSEILVYEQETVAVDTVVGIIETNGGAPVIEEEKHSESTTIIGGNLIDIVMPKMGESVMEGTVISWLKKVGEHVKIDEIIFEIATDKVDTEVPSPAEGVLEEILVSENETVEVGTVVARVKSSKGVAKNSFETKEHIMERESAPENNRSEIPSDHAKTKENAGANKFFSPLVMNIATREHVSFEELNSIIGSGANGRVTKNDIMNYLENRGSISGDSVREITEKNEIINEEKSVKFSDNFELIPMDNIRKRIQNHMLKSRDTSVHVTAVIEVDVSKIARYISENRNDFLKRFGVKLTYLPFISHVVIRALREFDLLNGSIDGENIKLKKFINLGIAVAVEPNGLIVPNIKNAEEKNLVGLAKSIAELSRKSREKSLTPDDITDGTFTITNYGVFGTLFGTPIINQPELAILGVGTVTKKPVVVETSEGDSISIKPMMYLSLSHDHRLIDGMLGGRFLKFIKDGLENFDTNIV